MVCFRNQRRSGTSSVPSLSFFPFPAHDLDSNLPDPIHPLSTLLASLIPLLTSLQTLPPNLPLQSRSHSRILRSLSTRLHSPTIFSDYEAYLSFSHSVGFLPHPMEARKLALFSLSIAPGPAGSTFRFMESHNRRLDTASGAGLGVQSPARLESVLRNLEWAAQAAEPTKWREGEGDMRQWEVWRGGVLRDTIQQVDTKSLNPYVLSLTSCYGRLTSGYRRTKIHQRPRAMDFEPPSRPTSPSSSYSSFSPPSNYSSHPLTSNVRSPTSRRPSHSHSHSHPYSRSPPLAQEGKKAHYKLLPLPPPLRTPSEISLLRKNLPADRRCPPLPSVVGREEQTEGGGGNVIRTRRGGVEMRELEWGRGGGRGRGRGRGRRRSL